MTLDDVEVAMLKKLALHMARRSDHKRSFSHLTLCWRFLCKGDHLTTVWFARRFLSRFASFQGWICITTSDIMETAARSLRRTSACNRAIQPPVEDFACMLESLFSGHSVAPAEPVV